MNIKHGKNQFYIGEEKAPKAFLTYVPTGESKIIIDHTEVSTDLKGKGVGKQLVEEVVNYARQNNKSIIPLCPFAKSVFDKHIDFQDVLN